jgi:hypothetical protein
LKRAGGRKQKPIYTKLHAEIHTPNGPAKRRHIATASLATVVCACERSEDVEHVRVSGEWRHMWPGHSVHNLPWQLLYLCRGILVQSLWSGALFSATDLGLMTGAAAKTSGVADSLRCYATILEFGAAALPWTHNIVSSNIKE